MRPTAEAQLTLDKAIESRDLHRIIQLTSKWQWDWDSLAVSAASRGDRDMCIYFIGKGADVIEEMSYTARQNGHYNLSDLLYEVYSYE
jgi:hypothetical protein